MASFITGFKQQLCLDINLREGCLNIDSREDYPPLWILPTLIEKAKSADLSPDQLDAVIKVCNEVYDLLDKYGADWLRINCPHYITSMMGEVAIMILAELSGVVAEHGVEITIDDKMTLTMQWDLVRALPPIKKQNVMLEDLPKILEIYLNAKIDADREQIDAVREQVKEFKIKQAQRNIEEESQKSREELAAARAGGAAEWEASFERGNRELAILKAAHRERFFNSMTEYSTKWAAKERKPP